MSTSHVSRNFQTHITKNDKTSRYILRNLLNLRKLSTRTFIGNQKISACAESFLQLSDFEYSRVFYEFLRAP